MPLSNDATLPIECSPVWPAICVLCGDRSPDSVFRFRACRVGWEQIVTLHWAHGSRPWVETPACNRCAIKLRRERRLRWAFSYAVIIPVALLGYFVLHQLGWLDGALRPFRKWIAAAMILAVLVPYIIWEMIHPARLDATAHGRTVTYEFADEEYAAQFAACNDEI